MNREIRMTWQPLLLSLCWLMLSLPSNVSRPLQLVEDEVVTTTYPPGPPEILSDEDDDEEYDYSETDLNFLEEVKPDANEISVEIDAFVSRAPPGVLDQNTTEEMTEYDEIINNLLDVEKTSLDLGLQLTWWQILVLTISCLLVTCLFCYFTSCCYLTLDCCSDPYWGCCTCLGTWVSRTKPPPHVSTRSRSGHRDVTVSNSKYSLNENSTAPRTNRASNKSLTYSQKGSSKSVNVTESALNLNGGDHSNSQFKRKFSKERRGSDEEEHLLSGSGAGDRTNIVTVSPSVHTLSSAQTATLNSVKSVRNYKRTRPASTLNGHGSFSKNAGLSESLPHVYQDGTGSYFSWMHLFGRNKRRYNVSRRKKTRGGNVSGTNNTNNNIYRQTRYRHIAESRNSAVIPTKIAKRSSTASTYNTRPTVLSKRSRSAETVDSVEDVIPPMLETVSSEKHLPRSRLSANLAQLEIRNNVGVGVKTSGNQTAPEYNLKYFEKSLMKSKETTL